MRPLETFGRALRALANPRLAPWYPTALMFGFLLNAYSFEQVHPLAVIRPLVLGLLVAAILTLIIGAAFRHWHAGGLVAGVLLGGLLGWGRANTVLASFLDQRLIVKLVLGAVVVIAAIVSVWLFRRLVSRPEGWARLTYGLNVLGILFVAVGIVLAIRSGALSTAASDLLYKPPVTSGPATAEAPNIYLIMLDEYARPDVLQSIYGIDEGPFLDGLTQRGFEVASGNSANYIATPYNLMAMFHMRHVPDIAEMQPALAGRAPFQVALRESVNRNEAFDLLHQHGYQIVEVAPPWEDVALRDADVYIDNGGINEFETSLIVRTALDDILRVAAPDFLFAQERDRITFAFDEIGRIAAEPSTQPRFIFVHIPAPHLPVVFGPHGEPVRMPYGQFFWIESAVQRGISRQEFIDAYRGQLQYINGLTLPAVDQVVAHDPNAVVIVFGDEGSGIGMNWEDVPGSDLAERFANMFASRTPGRPRLLEPAKTLINVLPILFKSYLGEDVPLQPDLHYAWRDGKQTDLYLWQGTPGAS